jgi:hypothetical protein
MTSVPSTSAMTHSLSSPLQLFVKTISGKTVTLNLRGDENVVEVKGEVEEKEGIPPHLQHLVWGGRHLQGNHTISDYGVTSGATLHLTLSLAGGMPRSDEVNMKHETKAKNIWGRRRKR